MGKKAVVAPVPINRGAIEIIEIGDLMPNLLPIPGTETIFPATTTDTWK